MFTDDIRQLERAITALKEIRKKAGAEGDPLEEIHRRLLHLQQSLKFARRAREEWDKALGPGLAEDDDEELV